MPFVTGSGHIPRLSFDMLWNWDEPAVSEDRFRALEAELDPDDERPYFLEVETQLARAIGMQGRYAEAQAVLDRVSPLAAGTAGLAELPDAAAVRCALERGRVFHGAGDVDNALTWFHEAWERATAAKLPALAIDAAHMLGIAAPPDEALAWGSRALAIVEASEDPAVRAWRGPLLNNTGWTCFDAGRYEEALDYFRRDAAHRAALKRPEEERISRQAIGRALRALGRIDEALALQQELAGAYETAGRENGYVFEEVAECLLALGRGSEARPWFRRAHAVLARDTWLVAHEQERLERLRALGA